MQNKKKGEFFEKDWREWVIRGKGDDIRKSLQKEAFINARKREEGVMTVREEERS